MYKHLSENENTNKLKNRNCKSLDICGYSVATLLLTMHHNTWDHEVSKVYNLLIDFPSSPAKLSKVTQNLDRPLLNEVLLARFVS